MFGYYVFPSMNNLKLMNLFFLLLVLFLMPKTAYSQVDQATVVGESPYVYKNPDFDSAVLAELQQGEVFTVSKSKKNGFHKIRVKKGFVGWIPDSEIRIGKHKINSESDTISEADENRIDKARKNINQPIEHMRFRGLSYESVLYTESTLGRERSAAVPSIGLKFSGPNTLFSGMMPADTTILYSYKAPSYYEKVTGNSASGYIIIGSFQFLNNFSKSKNFLLYYGFGPVLRYSHFDLSLGSGASQTTYSVEDMAIGASFSFGLAYRMGTFSVRPDIKYYWEKNKYLSFGLAMQMAF